MTSKKEMAAFQRGFEQAKEHYRNEIDSVNPALLKARIDSLENRIEAMEDELRGQP
jgi:hypothetical protein